MVRFKIGFFWVAPYPMISVLLAVLVFSTAAMAEGIVIGNRSFGYEIGTDGRNLHFIDVATRIDYLDHRADSRFARVTVDGVEYPVTEVRGQGKLLYCRFGGSGVKAELRWEVEGRYIRLIVDSVSRSVDELVFLDVPLTLKGATDEPFSACVLALNLFTHVRELPALQTHLWAACNERFGIRGAAVALLAVAPGDMLGLIRTVMTNAKDIPLSTAGGAWAHDNKEGYGSYLMNFGSLTAGTVDKWVAMCRGLGFTQIDNHGGGFFNFGELKIDPGRFPGGWADFRRINERLHDSGISSILHTYAFFIDKTSAFVTPEASADLGYFRSFTLAEPLAPGDTVITVRESTADVSTVTGFFVRNSVSLRIGGEIIEFKAVTKSPPYRFTGCKRGAFGTKIAAYNAGERAYHLKEVYGRFVPDPDAKLFMEIARRTADVINEADFDGLYLDAIDGGDVLGGGRDYWYYTSKFIFEIARRLRRPVGMEMASMTHLWWHYRMRWQAWDMPLRGYKRFVDIHVAALKSPNLFLPDTIRYNEYEHGIWRGDTSDINRFAPLPNGSVQLPLNLGWWGNQIGDPPQTETSFPDDAEYLCCKMIGNDAGVAVISGFDQGTISSIPLFGKLDSIIRLYEGLRVRHYFNAEVKARLRQPGKEFHLFREAGGGWNFRPVVYDQHKTGNDSVWTMTNPFSSQRAKLRIEALMAAGGYDDTASRVLADVAPGGFVQEAAAEGVRGGLSPDGEFWAQSSGAAPARAAYIGFGHGFEPALDLGRDQALGVWVKGDSSGALLNLRLESPKYLSHGARGDHYIHIDFRGWRYYSLVELESTEFSNYTWPLSDLYVYDSYRHSLDFKLIDRLQVWYNNLPPGRRVSCVIRPVKAVPLVAEPVHDPVLVVDGHRLLLPVTMKPGMYVEMDEHGEGVLYGSKGERLQEVRAVGQMPVLNSGGNTVRFSCGPFSGARPRVKVTIIAEGEPIKKD